MTATGAPDRFHLDGAAQRWLSTHSWNRPSWTVEELTAAKRAAGKTVSVVLPALDEEQTVGGVVASIAGLLKSVEDGWVSRGSTVVCTVTGNGLKDPQWALEAAPDPIVVPVDAAVAAVALGLRG